MKHKAVNSNGNLCSRAVLQRGRLMPCQAEASLTTQKSPLQVQDPAEGRVMMDEALDFRGNLYFGSVAACCIGCACWQRSFNLVQRWVLILVCMSLVGIYTPWAFGQSLSNLHSYGGKC